MRCSLRENRVLRGISLGLGDLLRVLASDLALVLLDIDPSHPLWSGMLRNCFGESDCEVIDWLFRLIGRPDRIEAPAAASFNEDSHCESVHHSEEFTLVANESEHHPGEEVVVDVKAAAWRQSFRIPNNETNQNGCPCYVAQKAITVCETFGAEVQDSATDTSHHRENNPSEETHLREAFPCQGKVLKWSNIRVRELQAQEEEACHPEMLVIGVDLLLSVGFASWSDLAAIVLQIVTLLDSVEKEHQVVIALQDGA